MCSNITGEGLQARAVCAGRKIGSCIAHRGAERGSLFGFDALVAFIACCISVYVIVVALNADVSAVAGCIGSCAQQRISLAVMDALVKNSDENGFGCAHYNSALHRVEEGVVDLGLLKNTDVGRINVALGSTGLKLEELYVEFMDGKREYAAEGAKSGSCISAERFVIVKSAGGMQYKKARLVGVVCGETARDLPQH